MSSPSPHELDLIRRANAGDEDALGQIYREHRGWVVGLARRYVGTDADATDVLQDVFTDLFGRFPGFALTSTFRGYLFPLERNKAVNLVRSRKKVVPLLRADEQEGGLVPLNDTAGDFERMVGELPPPQRNVVMLRFAAQLRLDEIAEVLGIPPGTVKSRLHNALKTLRLLIES